MLKEVIMFPSKIPKPNIKELRSIKDKIKKTARSNEERLHNIPTLKYYNYYKIKILYAEPKRTKPFELL